MDRGTAIWVCRACGNLIGPQSEKVSRCVFVVVGCHSCGFGGAQRVVGDQQISHPLQEVRIHPRRLRPSSPLDHRTMGALYFMSERSAGFNRPTRGVVRPLADHEGDVPPISRSPELGLSIVPLWPYRLAHGHGLTPLPKRHDFAGLFVFGRHDHLADALGRFSKRIVHKMCVTLGRRCLSVAQERAD